MIIKIMHHFFSAENIFEDIQARLDDLAGLEEKVDATIGTVIALGDTVVKHDKEIAELGEGLDQLEERVEDVEEDVEEAKIKIEEVDNKVLSSNATVLLRVAVT